MELISVIIPAYKAELFLKETVDSLINQTYKNWECIIVNDGSPDNTLNVAIDLTNKDKRIMVLDQKNGGVSKARNAGYELCSGNYIAYFDADDVWLPKRLELMLAKFKEDNFGLVHTDMKLINENSEQIEGLNCGLEGYVLDDLLLWEQCVIPAPSSILVKREVIQLVGGFDPDLSTAADQEFFFRVASKYKIGRVKKILGLYRKHSNSMSNNVKLLEKDHTLAYEKAEKNNLYKNSTFRNKCFSNMYIIIGSCWWVNANNKLKAIQLFSKALLLYPANISKLLKKAF